MTPHPPASDKRPTETRVASLPVVRASFEPARKAPPVPEPRQPPPAPAVPQQPVQEVEVHFEPNRPEPVDGEMRLWRGRPSQIANLRTFLGCGFTMAAAGTAMAFVPGLAPPGIPTEAAISLLATIVLVALCKAAVSWLRVRTIRYELTSQRFRSTSGILSRVTEEIELYRIKDTAMLLPLLPRLFRVGHVVLFTSDPSAPTLILEAVPSPRELRETIRTHVEQRRQDKGVRQVDLE